MCEFVTDLYMCVFLCVCVFACVYVHAHTRHSCVCVFVFVCVGACTHSLRSCVSGVCMCVRVYVHAQTRSARVSRVCACRMENPDPEVESVEESPEWLAGLTLDSIMSMDDSVSDPVTVDEIFHLLKDIKDPEHPELSLAQLRVVRSDQIQVNSDHVVVEYTPTIPTCSVAVLIGLTLLRKLQLCVPMHVHVRIRPGKHIQELQVNKQLADKERVAAAMENPNLARLVREGLYQTDSIPTHLLIW